MHLLDKPMRLQIYVFFSNYKQHSNFSILNFEFQISNFNSQLSIFNFQFSIRNGSNGANSTFIFIGKVFV